MFPVSPAELYGETGMNVFILEVRDSVGNRRPVELLVAILSAVECPVFWRNCYDMSVVVLSPSPHVHRLKGHIWQFIDNVLLNTMTFWKSIVTRYFQGSHNSYTMQYD